MIYLLLFWEFFKTGLFAMGGGLATLPFLYHISDRYHWFSHDEIANMLAVSESTPGPIGVNMATYCGMTTAGIPGGIIATFGLVLPSVIIILLIASLLAHFQKNRYVVQTMKTLRPASVGLVGAATWSVLRAALFVPDTWTLSWIAIAVFVMLLAVRLRFEKLHPIFLIAVGAAAGIVFQMGGI